MIENVIEYRGETPPEGVVNLIEQVHEGESIEQDELLDKQIYAILEAAENAYYITLGYHLPEEAAILESDAVFNQEFRIRLVNMDDEVCEQVMYRSTQINPDERMGPDAEFIHIDESLYKDFYADLKEDGLLEWDENNRRVLAD